MNDPMDAPERVLEPYVYVEPREASAVHQIVASGLGSVLGRAAANAARLGPLGALVGMIGGACAGHFLVTHRFSLGGPRRRNDPESPARYSDRR
ncbi:MAG: hypothetical protein AB7N76_19720 [Planctomycetota bacterium]